MRNGKVKKIALAAVLTAFSTAFLYLAAILPTGQLGFLGVASLFGIAAVVELGLPGGAFVYGGTAVLGLVLVPAKTLAGLYTVFFGPYPIVKALAERRGAAISWAVKLVFFNLALTAAIFAFKMTVFDLSTLKFGVPVMYVLGNAVFAVFDIAVTRAIGFYMARIHPKIHR